MLNQFTGKVALGSLVLLTLGGTAHGQYSQVYPEYGAYGGFYPSYSSTIGEGYLRGEAAYTQAYGQSQLSQSQAAVYQEQARKASIENDALWTQRRIEYKEWSAKNRRREAEQQYAETARYLANRPKLVGLDANQIDEHGNIAWPKLLESKVYAADRAVLDEYFYNQANGIHDSHSMGALVAARKRIANEFETHVDQIPQQDFILAMRFLNRLNVQIQKPQSVTAGQMSKVKTESTNQGFAASKSNGG